MTAIEQAQHYQKALTLSRVVEITGFPRHILRYAITKGHLRAIRPPGVRAWRVTEQGLNEWLSAGIPSADEEK
ncbi:hypothetical protein [Deinococcus aquaticus]|uniref:hypothetical protein n=1 Tax=Deinococcus aquaticus TaxID=328692 RepID=UPI0030A788B7